MTIAITCTCSARLEVDEKFAGETINCPDCQKPLNIPEPEEVTQRTSGYALTSLVLAMVGAFTIVGTLAAIIFGFLGLVQIRKHPERVAGKGYAVSGIALGVILTLISLFAYSSVEIFGLDAWLRNSQWIGRLEYPSNLKINQTQEGYAIHRPNENWGIFREDHKTNLLPQYRDLLLVNPTKNAYVLCILQEVPSDASWYQCREEAQITLKTIHLDRGELKTNLRGASVGDPEEVKRLQAQPSKNYSDGLEMLIKKTFRGEERTFRVYLIKNEKQRSADEQVLYIVAGGAPSSNFADVEEEIQSALDSFRVTGIPIKRYGG